MDFVDQEFNVSANVYVGSLFSTRLYPGDPAENRCSINVNPPQPFGRIAVEETDSDLFAAIDRGTGKIRRVGA